MRKTSQNSGKRVAMFAGSFDPFTVGHESIVTRALPLFDEIVVAVGANCGKNPLATPQQRAQQIRQIFSQEPKVKVTCYSGLTTDAAAACGASCLLRGVRTLQDFENEKCMADANRALAGIETMLIYTLPEYAYISSSLVRELIGLGRDVSAMLPKACRPAAADQAENTQD